MMRRKGQAALEFLTTYGWAFLVILVMIGALAYFGVLDPSRFTPQRCQFGAPLVCDGENYKMSNSTQEITVRVRNTLNKPYTVTNFQVKDDAGVFQDCTNVGGAPYPYTVPVDGYADLVCVVPADPGLAAAGTKQRVAAQLFYHEGDATFTKSIPGEIYANIVP